MEVTVRDMEVTVRDMDVTVEHTRMYLLRVTEIAVLNHWVDKFIDTPLINLAMKKQN